MVSPLFGVYTFLTKCYGFESTTILILVFILSCNTVALYSDNRLSCTSSFMLLTASDTSRNGSHIFFGEYEQLEIDCDWI